MVFKSSPILFLLLRTSIVFDNFATISSILSWDNYRTVLIFKRSYSSCGFSILVSISMIFNWSLLVRSALLLLLSVDNSLFQSTKILIRLKTSLLTKSTTWFLKFNEENRYLVCFKLFLLKPDRSSKRLKVLTPLIHLRFATFW